MSSVLKCKRQPLPDYRMLMGLMFLPVICVFVYYGFHNFALSSDRGIVPLTFNRANYSSSDALPILAVPFSSGPLSFPKMYNVSLHYQSNKNGEACFASTMTASPDGNYTFNALKITNLALCFPEDIAQAAKSKGFNLVIYQSPYKVAGYSALAIWKKNSAPIPILEINYLVSFDEIATADIDASANPYLATHNLNVMLTLSIAVGFLGALQVWVAVIKLLDLGVAKKLNTKLWVCGLQIVSGILRVIFSFDLTGYHHTINYPAFNILLTLGMILIFITVFLVASAFHFAILAINKTKVSNNKPFWGLLTFVMIFAGVSLFSGGMAATLAQNSTYYNILITAIAASFQVVSGVYFVINKRKVVSMLSQSASNKQAGRGQELKRMSVYLYLSIIPMLGFMASLGLWAERYAKRTPNIISVAVAAMASALTELTLICSFPVKQRRGVLEATAPTEAGTNDTGRESVVRLSPRLSSRPSSTANVNPI